MKTRTLGEVEAAVNSLLSGYQEELNLYLVVRNLTMAQRELLTQQHAAVGIAAGLTQRADFMRFTDLLDEKEDILRSLAEGGKRNADGVQAIVQIFAKTSLLEGRRQLPVRRRDDTDVDFARDTLSHALELAMLEEPEKFHLR